MTLLAFVASSPHANAWVLSEFTKIVGWNIANPTNPTENIRWNSLDININGSVGSVDFVALESDAYISLVANGNQAVGSDNVSVKVGDTYGPFDNNASYSIGNDPGDYCKLKLTGMTAGATYTLTLGISDGKPKVTSFKLKYPVLYLRGQWHNDQGNTWPAEEYNKFTQANGIYTLILPNEILANSQWKIATGTWGEYEFNSKGKVTLANVTGVVEDDSRNNYNLYVTSDLPKDTKFTFTYNNADISQSTLKIEAASYEQVAPVILEAAQRMEGTNNSLYTFDLELKPTLKADALARVVNDKSGSSMATSVVITPDADTQAAIKAARAIDLNGWTKNADGTFTYTFNKDNLTLPTLTIRDIAPNKGLANAADNKEYKFNVELTSTDTDWQYLKYTKAEPVSASIYAPTVDIILDQPTIDKVTPTIISVH